MPNTYLDKAIEAVPKFEERISLFTKKLRLAQYADSTIYSYRLKISQAVLYLKKLPDNFTQADVDDYLTMLLDRNCYSLSFFKHTVFGMKDYYKSWTSQAAKPSAWDSRSLEDSSFPKCASPRDFRVCYLRNR